VSRTLASPARVAAAGVSYSLGRALTYVLLGMLVVSGALAVPALSFFLQERMNQILGPALVLFGSVLLLAARVSAPGWSLGGDAARRVAARGFLGAGALGMVLALSFCPVSAGLFFGGLVPLAVGTGSRLLLPALFGVGTALPVVAFAILLALAASRVGRAFRALTGLERVARPATGVAFVLAGLWLTLRHVFGAAL
jgi:cytochrome c biogenesis protein CcdA